MKRYGLIGFPLVQSFSKKYFTDKFQQEAIHDCLFDLYPLTSIQEFPALIHSTPSINGLAVTIPYKQQVIPFLDAMEQEALEIAAVNCIQFNNGQLIGHNTDVIGFRESLLPLLEPQHGQALVLGTGGASKAVQYVLKKLGIEFLLVSRNPSEGQVHYSQIDAHMLHSYPLLINCTPVGMVPNESTAPDIPYQYLGNNNLLYDLVYKPAETIFLQKGARQGASVKNGYEMLILQAEANWKIWNS